MNVQYLSIDELKIEYLKLGSGPDLLFLHGGSVSFRTNLPFLQEASKHFKVWAFSFPGAGKSSKLPKKWKFENYAEIVKGFIEKLDINPIVCGHSVGGAIALVAKSKYPELFKHIVLFAPSGIPKFATNRSEQMVARNHICELIFGPKYARRDVILNLTRHAADLKIISNMFRNFDVRPYLGKIIDGVHIMWARNDEVISIRSLDVFKRLLVVTKCYLFDGSHEFLGANSESICDILKTL